MNEYGCGRGGLAQRLAQPVFPAVQAHQFDFLAPVTMVGLGGDDREVWHEASARVTVPAGAFSINMA